MPIPMDKIIEWIKQDEVRLKAIENVYQLGIPHCYVAAGFVRNLVWDHLHQFTIATPLNDVDVIYFDPEEHNPAGHEIYEDQLKALMPELQWQVRNQAIMHLQNGDPPYLSCEDAMSYWPEKETAVAVRKTGEGDIECISVFGFESLLNLQITWNPKRSHSVFEQRIKAKGWVKHWCKLRIAI